MRKEGEVENSFKLAGALQSQKRVIDDENRRLKDIKGGDNTFLSEF